MEKGCLQCICKHISFHIQSLKQEFFFLINEDNFEVEKENNFICDCGGFILKWHSTFGIVLKILEFEIWRRQKKEKQLLFTGTCTFWNISYLQIKKMILLTKESNCCMNYEVQLLKEKLKETLILELGHCKPFDCSWSQSSCKR